MTTLDANQRATLLDRLFRRIGKLDDDDLIRLEAFTRTVDVTQPVQSTQPLPAAQPIRQTQPSLPRVDPNQQSRRYFLMMLAGGGVLAAAAGGVAIVALQDEAVRRQLRDSGWLPTSTPLPPTVTPGPSPTATLPPAARSQIADLQGQIAGLVTERDSLQAQLDNANSSLAALRQTNASAQDLLGLHRQLEGINLDQIVVAGLAALGVPVLAIDTIQLALNTGIALAVRILQGVEDQMPLIAAGLDWLDQQVTGLSNGLRAVKDSLQVSNTNTVTLAVTNFISTVLDLLPFGAGQDIKTALQAMGDVITHLPDLLDNVTTRVLQPARAWIVSGKAGGLYDYLLTPLRDQLLSPAQQIVANAQNLNQVYNTQLAQPAQSALDQRAKIRAEIAKKAGT